MEEASIYKSLKLLDNKYTMAVYYYTNGKIGGYTIVEKDYFNEKYIYPGSQYTAFLSLKDGIKHAGKNCNKIIFTSIDEKDLKIINKYYKKCGGYVTL